MRRWGSRVAASDMTTKGTCPGSSRFMPSFRDRIRHFGGKMLDTRTRLHAAMPAERSASSNEGNFSPCLQTPLVKNISLGTNPTTSGSLRHGTLHGKQRLLQCQGSPAWWRAATLPPTALRVTFDRLAHITIRCPNTRLRPQATAGCENDDAFAGAKV